jgi:hypothetical protein
VIDRELALALTRAELAERADPLVGFGWPSAKHRNVIEHFARRVEVHHRAGNKGAKTFNWAAAWVAMARLKRELAGVRLPVFEGPVDLAVLVPSYKQAVDSSNKALFHWLGDYPHVPGWINRSQQLLGMLAIKPDGWHNADSTTWSKILFVSQEDNNPKSVEGQRWHAAAGDEPPTESYWRETRKNAPYRLIAETPLERGRWQWIREDFAQALGHVHRGRIEIVSTLYDNRFLSDQEREELIQSYEGDAFHRPDEGVSARVNGDYMNVEGMSPWKAAGLSRLQLLRGRCQPGGILPLTIPGRDVPFECEQWFRPRRGEGYILSADLGEGIDDGNHDPLRFDLKARKVGVHALCWQGYEDSYHVGLAAAHLGEAYNDAWIDFDATGGYGEGFMRGLLDYQSREHPNGYRRIVRSEHSTEPGKVESRYGYKVTDGVRAEIVSGVREWLLKPLAEADADFRTWDASLIDGLLGIRMVKTPSGGLKVMSTGKDHDEPMFTTGRLLALDKVLPLDPVERDRLRDVREVVRETFGRDLLPPGAGGNGKRRVIDNFGS